MRIKLMRARIVPRDLLAESQPEALFYLDDCQPCGVQDISIKEDINVEQTGAREDHLGDVT
jgi:hypothetical protein